MLTYMYENIPYVSTAGGLPGEECPALTWRPACAPQIGAQSWKLGSFVQLRAAARHMDKLFPPVGSSRRLTILELCGAGGT